MENTFKFRNVQVNLRELEKEIGWLRCGNVITEREQIQLKFMEKVIREKKTALFFYRAFQGKKSEEELEVFETTYEARYAFADGALNMASISCKKDIYELMSAYEKFYSQIEQS